MKIDDNSLFFTCSLLELIGRTTLQKRSAVTELLGKKVIAHIYANADVLHCEPIAKTADYYIDFCHIPAGDFDNVAACKYAVPSYWDIGKVYARLIEDVAGSDAVDTLLMVYHSAVSDMISNYNSDFFYQSREYIKEYFISCGDLSEIKQRKPAIRFSGFTDAWEQRRLSHYLETSNEKNTEDIYGIDDVLSVSGDFGVVNQIEFQGRSFAGASVAGYGILHTGEVVYTKSPLKSAPYGIIKTNQGKTGIVSVLYGVYHPRENLQPELVQIYFEQNARLNNYLRPLVNKGAKNTLLISDDDALQGEVIFPKAKSEQQKICSFFRHLDDLITLHQRKYDKLSKIKKSMLEKLFPKNGSNVPEIRFAGFTDAWEQRKLGDIGTVSMNKRIFKEQTSESGEIPFYKIGTFGGIADAFISRELFEEYKVKFPYPQKGDILISASGSIGRTIEFSGRNEYFQDSNIVWLAHGGRIKNSFLKYFYATVKWAGVEGSTIKRLYNSIILETPICLPSQEEQQKIGQFFRSLDSLITLHQRKLEKLKKIKQSCLEKMFV